MVGCEVQIMTDEKPKKPIVHELKAHDFVLQPIHPHERPFPLLDDFAHTGKPIRQTQTQTQDKPH
jgi:hypothetical protein